MPIQFPLTKYVPGQTNVAMRLTAADTRFLKSRIDDAITKGRGVNLIIHNLRGAFCIIHTKERGWELSVTAHAHAPSYRVETPQEGYTQDWSHVEIYMETTPAVKKMEEFVQEVSSRNAQGKLWQQEGSPSDG